MVYGYIYKITNLINGKVYIGQAIDVMARWKKHIYASKTATKGVDAAIIKYGAENFTVVTICSYGSKQDLDDAEKYFIAVYRHFYGRKGCYNQADGGQGGCVWGEKHPMKGKQHTEETKKKQSDAHKGIHTGEKHTEEHNKNVSAAMKGNKNAIRKPVLQYDLQGNFIREWESISQAAKELKISKGNISSCCKGKLNKAGGFIWRYKEEETK